MPLPMNSPVPLLWCMFSDSKMSLLPLFTEMPLFEAMFIGTFATSSPLKCSQLPLTEKPFV